MTPFNKNPNKEPLKELNKTERTILSVISLIIGLGLAFGLNFMAARMNLGSFWLRAVIAGVLGGGAYLFLDYRLFNEARKNLGTAKPIPTNQEETKE